MCLVLVVDDDLDLLDLYTELLGELGVELVSAQDGVEALRLALELKPALILTDWRMPRMDGVELCKALRSSGLSGRTLLVLHSSEAAPPSGCADVCLRKPTSPEAFKSVIQALLQNLRCRAFTSRSSRDCLDETSWAAQRPQTCRGIKHGRETVALEW